MKVYLLGLDPSSTRTGYSGFSQSGELVDCGLIKPEKASADAIGRISSMVVELMELLVEWMPEVVIVEVPSGKVGSGERRGAGSRLCVYGLAVGAMWQTCVNAPGVPIVDVVDERTWTKSVAKPERQKRIAVEFPRYREVMDKDGGMDVSDAIGIGLYWFANRRTK